jgi:putative hydrolase of the HAD superfamily
VLVSNFYGNIESVLADFDLLRYFPTIIESAVVGVRKPDPQIFRLGVEAMGIPAEQVLVVGDSYKKDIVPAETIGCQVAWLKGKGWTADEDAVTHPNIIKSLEDLL